MDINQLYDRVKEFLETELCHEEAVEEIRMKVDATSFDRYFQLVMKDGKLFDIRVEQYIEMTEPND